MRFYTTHKLGPKRSLTPEGFLLCEDVPVARTGEMLYAKGEIPVDADADGLIRVSRNDDDLFADTAIASCVGKSVTLDHPDEFVDPTNYKTLSAGTMLNVRRGDGIENDLLLADLLITDGGAIKAVQEDGIEEVSLGYDADYEQVSLGRGAQRNIIVNHVALVARGRCGPRCAIGDKLPEEMQKMAKKRTWADRIRTAFKAKDSEALEEALEEKKTADEEIENKETEDDDEDDKKSKTGDSAALAQILKHVKALDRRMTRIEHRDEESENKETEDDDDDDSETNDEADLTVPETAEKLDKSGTETHTGDSLKTVLARAEILAPGIKMPTHDKRMSTKDAAKAICSCQRRALDHAYQTDEGHAAITPFLGSRTADFNALPAALINTIFTGAAELMKVRNNDSAMSRRVSTKDFGKAPMSIKELNAQNKKYWADKAAK